MEYSRTCDSKSLCATNCLSNSSLCREDRLDAVSITRINMSDDYAAVVNVLRLLDVA